ncbi:MAG: anti-sigma F factor [bacterium]|nr:anti-sigma F factor [bacterium]
MNRMKLEFISVSQNERFARSAASAFVLELDPTLQELSEIKTAVSEAVTNAIIHGYRGTTGTITMEGSIYNSIVELSIYDKGAGIADIDKAMEPMYTGAPDEERSGLGFTIMQTFMDELEVESEPGMGTRITMRKKIGSAG